jgi:hypothetical protein
MSTDASTDAGAPERTTDYEAMLDDIDAAIEQARYKVENGRVRDESKEKVRIKWCRALAYAVNVRRQVANDRDLEELAEQVEQLKARQEGSL